MLRERNVSDFPIQVVDEISSIINDQLLKINFFNKKQRYPRVELRLVRGRQGDVVLVQRERAHGLRPVLGQQDAVEPWLWQR